MSDPGRIAAMWTLAVDSVTAEVVAAFDAAAVDCLLLKGPSVAAMLYEDERERPYVDTDLLVHPDRVRDAEAALQTAGFRRAFGPLPHPEMERPPSSPWRRDAFTVDLHETLAGATADPRDVWAALESGAREQEVAGRPVRVLGEAARLAHLALHAAHHGPVADQPLRDLRRALELFTEDEWSAAAEVADRVGASAAFANGLGLTDRGRTLAERLGREPAYSAAWLLEVQDVALAAGIERLTTTQGVRARAAILRDELFPSQEFLRWRMSIEGRSWRGPAHARLWRLLHLARHARPALHTWRRARAAASETRYLEREP